MKTTITIFRIISGLLFLAIGLFHFYNITQMAIFVPLPYVGKIYVALVGMIISISSIGIIFNKFVKISFLTIAFILAFTGLFILMAVFYLKIEDPIMKTLGMSCLTELAIAILVLLLLASAKFKK